MVSGLSAIAQVIRRRMWELDIRTVAEVERRADGIARRHGDTVKKDTVRHLLSGRTQNPRSNKLRYIAEALEMSLPALVGADGEEGEPLRPRGAAASGGQPGAADGEGDYALVPRYDVRLAAGAGAFPTEEAVVDHMPFPRDWLGRQLGGQPANHLAVVQAMGESMEPVIRSGDDVLLNLNETAVADGGIYALIVNDTLVIKRCFMGPDGIEIRSDNPASPSWTVRRAEMGDLRVVGRAVLRIGRLA
ncbi:S24 family peptidase [Novispirillum sp. DQ9]|uniref:S24 family peptidase n=1 Tax=Novispirillum sp. DQ9 TaxID=3398612 RepID=UPI003C7D0776